MSIYTELLTTALDQARHPDDETTTGQALATLLDCRGRIGTSYSGPNWAPNAIADQLAYDVALIELACHLGIKVELSGFGPQHAERARLEQELVTQGIRLDGLDQGNEREDQTPLKWGYR